jgi:hypothetical protein
LFVLSIRRWRTSRTALVCDLIHCVAAASTTAFRAPAVALFNIEPNPMAAAYAQRSLPSTPGQHNWLVPKWIKTLIALALLPACAGIAMALWRVVEASASADTVWVVLLAGAGCWVAIYLLLPKPMWIYVFGHELTHAIWTWMMGGQVKKLKVSSTGGHVVVTRSGFLIALAPYFFPLYAMMVAAIFGVGNLIWNWRPYLVCFHLLLGAAYAFHLTLTWHILKSRQSDITDQGYIFSFVVIFLGNALVLLLGIPLLTQSVTLVQAFTFWREGTWAILASFGRLIPPGY